MSYTQQSLGFLAIALVFAGAEYLWRMRSGRGYDLASLGGNIGMIIGLAVSKALTGGIAVAGLMAAYHLAPMQFSLDDWRTWAAGFLVLEFFYYWQHRFSHTIRWIWTSHSVHHSATEFTLPAAFRLSWTGIFSGAWLVLTPMALIGFHPILITVLLVVNLRLQYFLHTESVRKLGPLEWVFNTPSHHRVHHGTNPEYIDKNFGGILIVFDRLFGTFAEECNDKPVIYGLTKPLNSNNPFIIAFHEWGNMFCDIRQARSMRQRLRALFGRPSDLTPANPARQAPVALLAPAKPQAARVGP
ncbi:MAG: sterol desaturase family protein [Pseudomonadota bacterium]